MDKNTEDESDNFLFWEPDNGLIVFIIVIVAYLIDCCYLKVFPNFSLPYGKNARSQYGLAFSGELNALQKMKIKNEDKTRSLDWNVKQFWGDNQDQQNKSNVALYAMANHHYHIVEWLETEHKCDKHKGKNWEQARGLVLIGYDGWID